MWVIVCVCLCAAYVLYTYAARASAACACYTLRMEYIFVGLGNPGEEYENTRHNTGRMLVEYVATKSDIGEWKDNKVTRARELAGTVGGRKARFVLPNSFMNNSGKSLVSYIKSKKDLERMVVIYDDLDLPLGTVKLSFGRSSGGHRGLESIIKNLKSKDFLRIRVGVSPHTPSGKLKKPSGEDKVIDFILGKFRAQEMEILKKVQKKVLLACNIFAESGREKAMTEVNS